ncbi:hypothetical protein ACNQFZ_18785 [Schinkia sp. CFF1]
MRLILIFSICFIILLGCSKANPPSNNEQNIIVVDTLPDAEKEKASALYKQMLAVNQIMEELDLIMVELQKADELEEAIEIMETAKNECNKIAVELRLMVIENIDVREFNEKYREALLSYEGGLELQIEGMKAWDGKKTTEGYKLTENAKTALKRFYEQFKEKFSKK